MSKEYMTDQGDMWDTIAKKTLGDESYMTDLIDANIEHRETVIFSANIKLVIPEITTTSSKVLPPWKKDGGLI